MLVRLLEHIDRQRFDLRVISLTDAGDLGDRIRDLGIEVLELNMRRGRPQIRAVLPLVKFLRHWRPSILHTWMYHSDLFGSVAAALVGRISVIWCVRASGYEHGYISPLTRLTVRAAALISHFAPARVVSCSRVAMQDHIRIGYRPDKFVVIPNGFDLDRFCPDAVARDAVRAELRVPEQAQVVGFVARFDPLKDHVGFLQAAASLLRVYPDVRFLLAGADVHAENRELSKAINDAGLAPVVYLLGKRLDVHRLMAALDVLVSASLSEAFPNVVAEAMACGVPCVVTDVGDSAFIVGNTGKVVGVGDTVGLARALHEVLQTPAADRSKLGRLARERIRDCFNIRQITREYEMLYEQLS